MVFMIDVDPPVTVEAQRDLNLVVPIMWQTRPKIWL